MKHKENINNSCSTVNPYKVWQAIADIIGRREGFEIKVTKVYKDINSYKAS